MRLISLIKGLIFLLLLTSGFIYFFAATNLGTVFAIRIVAKFLPGHLQVETIKGQLSSEITFENLSFSNENIHVSLKSLHYAWHPWKLINKKFIFDEIDVQGVRIDFSGNKNEKNNGASTFDLSNFLTMINHVRIYHLHIKDFRLFKENVILSQVDELTVLKRADNSNSFSLISPNGNMDGQFTVATSPNLVWRVELSGSNINPREIFGEWDGHINFIFKSTGIWGQHNKKVSLQLTDINGQLGKFPVQGFVSLDLENGKLEIHNSQLAIANAQAKIAGTFNRNWNMNWQVDIPELQTIVPNSHGSFSSTGKMIGPEKMPQIQANLMGNEIAIENIKIKKLLGNISSTLKFPSTNLALIISDVTISNYRIPKINLRVASNLAQQKLISNIVLSLSSTNQMNGQIILPQFKTFTDLYQPMEGEIKFNFATLNEMISAPEISDLQGKMQGSIKVSGTLSNPSVLVDASLKQGHLFIQRLGIALDDVSLQANYQTNQPVIMNGSFNAGKGQGLFNGQLNIHEPDFPAFFKIEGTNLQLADLNEYKIIVSPNLTISYNSDITKIEGQIVIPYAEITPKDFSSVSKLPSEVVIINEQSKTSAPVIPNNFYMDIKITLGKHIYLAYENLKTLLAGNLNISQNPGSPPVATGELHAIDGKYYAYGKLLTIKEGRLIYTGNSLSNPGLDVRAIEQFKTLAFEGGESMFNETKELQSVYTGSSNLITVGIWVKGTLNKPKVTLYSDPAGLSQGDILSYLVFGYPQSQIKTANKLALLNNIASSLYQDKTNVGGITKKFQNVLGLNEFSVGSTEYFDPETNSTANATAVRVGKQIGSRLSLHYSVGLFHSVSILNLRYQINKRLAIQSQTSSIDTGADLVYEFEKD